MKYPIASLLALSVLVSFPALAADPKRVVPLGDPSGWVTSDDYPASALREDREGLVRFILDIDTSGAPTNCTITQSSGDATLDNATCTILTERARFSPATSSTGKPIASTWKSSFRWEIPRQPLKVPVSTSHTVSFIINRDGSVSDCSVSNITGAKSEDLCNSVRKMTFEPALGADGKAVRKRVRYTQSSEVEDVGD
jgi:protein TonB